MTSYVTPKKGVEFIFYAGLPSVASSSIFQSNPTIAAGDFKVSIDGGALNNLATLPAVTPASSKMVKFTLSTSEMNGDNVTVIGSDAAGGEWKDIIVNIQTSARQIDDLAWPTTSGRSIDVSAGGEVGLDWANIGSPTTTVGLSGTTVKTATDVETDTADIQSRLPAALVSGRIDASVGAIAANAITAASIAADAGVEIATAVWDEDATTHQTQGTFGQVIGDSGATASSIWGLANTNLNATVSSRASQTSLDTLDDYVDTEVAAIKAKTDSLTFTVANQLDCNVIAISGDSVAADNLEAATDGTGYNVGNGSIVAASVTGAVGSVTGAVGSVTGNVGGNVSGSVGSVTAAVTVGTINSTASNIKKNTALAAFEFVMTDSTTHAPKTGVSVTATRSLDGGAFASCANAVTELSNGVYIINLAATDLNANTVTLRFTGASSDDTIITLITQP